MKTTKKLAGLILTMMTTAALSVSAFAAEAAETAEAAGASSVLSAKAIAAAIAIAIAAGGGALGMGLAVGKASEGVSRQPEANNKIQTLLMLGLVFIETAIIYALIVAILIIFVL